MYQGSIYTRRGILNTTINIIMSFWRRTTKQKYKVYSKHWLKHCKNHNIEYAKAVVLFRWTEFPYYTFQRK